MISKYNLRSDVALHRTVQSLTESGGAKRRLNLSDFRTTITQLHRFAEIKNWMNARRILNSPLVHWQV